MKPGKALEENLVKNLADRAAAALGAHPGGTWGRLRSLLPEQYAEVGGGLPVVHHGR